MFRPKFLNINEKALERIDHPFSCGMLRLQFDNDNNRLGKYVNDINDCEGEKDDDDDDDHVGDDEGDSGGLGLGLGWSH